MPAADARWASRARKSTSSRLLGPRLIFWPQLRLQLRCVYLLRQRQWRLTLKTKGHDFTVAIEKGEDGYYVASVVELPGCHTQAKTLKELDKRVKEAIEVYLEAKGNDARVPELVVVKKVHV